MKRWRNLILVLLFAVAGCEAQKDDDDASEPELDNPVPTESVMAAPGGAVSLSQYVEQTVDWTAGSGLVAGAGSDAWYLPPVEDGVYRVTAATASQDVLHLDVTVEGIQPSELADLVFDGSAGLSGRYGTTTFSARKTVDGFGEAMFSNGGQELVSLVTDHGAGTVSWNGQSLDGLGAMSDAEIGALNELAGSDLASAITMVSLELACIEDARDMDPVVGASLLLPWQLVLKYLSPYPVTVARHYAGLASCPYFRDVTHGADTTRVSGSPSPNVMLLSNESPLPATLFYFPLDAAGAARPPVGKAIN